MADESVGAVQNCLGGTVVVGQDHLMGSWISFFKLQNIGNGCSSKLVNRLIIITYHADVFGLGGQKFYQLVLGIVGILIFIHQNVFEFLLIGSQDLWALFEKVDGAYNLVAEIQKSRFGFKALIRFISPS